MTPGPTRRLGPGLWQPMSNGRRDQGYPARLRGP
jgi:hypothetical protein